MFEKNLVLNHLETTRLWLTVTLNVNMSTLKSLCWIQEGYSTWDNYVAKTDGQTDCSPEPNVGDIPWCVHCKGLGDMSAALEL